MKECKGEGQKKETQKQKVQIKTKIPRLVTHPTPSKK